MLANKQTKLGVHVPRVRTNNLNTHTMFAKRLFYSYLYREENRSNERLSHHNFINDKFHTLRL